MSNLISRITRLISTFFFVGYFPFIPGTIASLMGLGLFILFKDNLIVLLLLAILLLILGFYFSGRAEKYFNKKDAREIVIDEVSGMFLSLIFLPQAKVRAVLFFAFFAFRIFDWTKPFPIRRLQKLSGSLGIMLDDIVAAIYTAAVFQIFFKFASWMTS
ncbi:MAG: phosphatidylglycerophosphatase A [Candidatus Omnitrophica bacterium]|nr:phosphatidylglycerophosphatase A [Candidatus Omnitrophota bacterium]